MQVDGFEGADDASNVRSSPTRIESRVGDRSQKVISSPTAFINGSCASGNGQLVEHGPVHLRILALNYRCTRHPEAGGSEVNVFEQARRWVSDGHHVTVFTANPGRAIALQRDEIMDGITVRRRGGRFTVYLYAMIFLLWHSRRFDCILDVANGIPFFAPLVSKTPGALLIHHYHNRQWFSEFPYPIAVVGRFLEQRVVPVVYRRWPVIAVSPTTHDALVKLGVKPSQIRIVYNGTIQPNPGLQAGDVRMPHIAYIGRLKRYKRLDLLVRAIAQLRHEFPDIHLDIAGKGDAAPEIEALIRALHLKDNVTLHGFVEEQEKARILRSATVFATASMQEGWGLSVIEANAYGCPAVAYDVPGLCVAIRHGETGLLARDDTSFEQALAFFLNNPLAREQYSRAAQAWAARFTWDSCAESTLEVLQTQARRSANHRNARTVLGSFAGAGSMDSRILLKAQYRQPSET